MKIAAYCFVDIHPPDRAVPNHIQKNDQHTLCGIHLGMAWREMTGILEEIEPTLCLRCRKILKHNGILKK